MDRSRGGLRAYLLLERDTALQRGRESAELLENLGRAPKDRPPDAGEFGTDLAGGLAWASGSHPALEDRLGPIELLVGADDRDDLDGAVALGERLPEAAVRDDPRAERRQGVMAGIGVDEQRVVGIERDRQLEREVSRGSASGTGKEPRGEKATLDAQCLERADYLGLCR